MRTIRFLFALTFIASAASAATPTATVDNPAPDFTLKDAHGRSHSLSDYKGKYVVLEWVNFDCPFVHKHYSSGNMPSLQRTYTAKGVIWLSICSSAPGKQGYFTGDELTERISHEKAAPTAYLIDRDGNVGHLYGAKATPHMYVISPEGILLYAGGIDDIPSTRIEDLQKATNYVRAALDEAMAGEKVKVKTSRAYGCSVKYP
jgi:glutathione peroxidase-family protein